MKKIKIVVVDYNGSFQTAAHGLVEFFTLANQVDQKSFFEVKLQKLSEFRKSPKTPVDYVILPPNMNRTYYLKPDKECREAIRKHYQKNATICSVCAGAFILASSGIVTSQTLTTHWMLGEQLKSSFPDLKIDTDRILIDSGRIISAGGMMSWLDLAFQIVRKNCDPSTLGYLSHYLIISTGEREQKSYKRFIPDLNHSDEEIRDCQSYIAKNYSQHMTLAELSKLVHLTSRTLIRRFIKFTGMTPLDYIQSVRIQYACEKLESSNRSVERIANEVGYENVGAFRKVFIHKMGVKPLDFRRMHRSLPH